ncbi:MAG: hypothetical protein Q8P41_25215 [Pseudomonadota bacterium]|nr:hypothetical protein [Pseudomonadota bacterium]
MSTDPVRSAPAPAHPLVLGAAALILVNDWVLRGVAPGWLTGKLSDVGWLVVAPVLVAALVSRLGAPGLLAKAAGLLGAGAFYAALQVWPPLGAWIAPGHVADLGDLIVLPALLGAVAAWRGARGRAWVSLAALPVLGGVLIADDYALISPTSVPCGEAMSWDAADPLQLSFSSYYVPYDTDGFVRGLRLTDEDGREVPLVVGQKTGSWSSVVVCAREGLRANTGYTWEIGPWEAVSSNERAFAHAALPTVRFRTLDADGPAAADAVACADLFVEPEAGAWDRCSGGADTGWGDTGADTGADTGDTGAL